MGWEEEYEADLDEVTNIVDRIATRDSDRNRTIRACATVGALQAMLRVAYMKIGRLEAKIKEGQE